MGSTTSASQSSVNFTAQVAGKQHTQVPFTHYIILSLLYPGMSLENGFKLDLEESKNDFPLLLKRFGYFRNDNQAQFTLLNDFDYTPNDATSNAGDKCIPKADTSKDAIEKAIRATMRRTTPGSRVLFYCGAHGLDQQSVFAGDGQPIDGSELRSWLSDGVDSSVAVTAVLDTCTNGNILGLQYAYQEESGGVGVTETKGERSSVPILQISAAGKDEAARSAAVLEGECGLLTWFVSRYFEKLLSNPQDTTIYDIVHFLNERFEETISRYPQLSSPDVCNKGCKPQGLEKPQGLRKPQFSFSLKLEGQFPFF